MSVGLQPFSPSWMCSWISAVLKPHTIEEWCISYTCGLLKLGGDWHLKLLSLVRQWSLVNTLLLPQLWWRSLLHIGLLTRGEWSWLLSWGLHRWNCCTGRAWGWPSSSIRCFYNCICVYNISKWQWIVMSPAWLHVYTALVSNDE